MKRRVLQGLAFAGVMLALVAVRVAYSSHVELERGDVARDAGDLDGALLHWRRAAKWYAPGNPYVVRALDRLEALGSEREEAGDVDGALAAWRACRGSILAVRHVRVPFPERRQRADEHIARLMAGLPAPPVDADRTSEELYEDHYALLSQTPGPHIGFAMLAFLGFVAWVASALLLAYKGLDGEDRWVRAPALRAGLGVILGFAMFAVGLAFA